MNENFSDETLMIEYSQMPAGVDLKEVCGLNQMKEELSKSEVNVQHLLTMCSLWNLA